MAPSTYNKADLFYLLPVMTLMTVYSLYWFIYVMMNSKFRWVQFMLFMCVIQNINTVWLVITRYLAVTEFIKMHTTTETMMYSINVFIFYFTGNLMYWMFGFKYWVISVEVPRLIDASKEGKEAKHKSFCSEASYNALNWVGIIVNLFFCICVGWKRALLAK